MVATLDQLGRPRLLLSDDSALTGPVGAIALPAVRELFAPILHCGPAAVIAAEAARTLNAVHYCGQTGPWAGAAGANLVRNSKILLAGEEA